MNASDDGAAGFAGDGRWLVSVDRAACIGSGICAGTAPDRFALGPDHRASPIAREIDPDETVRDIAAQCPAEAIHLTAMKTGVPVGLDRRT